MVTQEKGPAEAAVEILLFAPIGFALEARKLLPTFVERGRQQVTMAKFVGQFAVTQGQREGRKHLSKAQDHAGGLLAELGLVGEPKTSGRPILRSEPVVTEPEPRSAQSSEASIDLAIADYDSLAASHVIPRLAGLNEGQLEAVRVYEAAHRGRKTILGKIAQIQAA